MLQLINDCGPDPALEQQLSNRITLEETVEEEEIALLAGQRELRPGDILVGSLPQKEAQKRKRALKIGGEQSDGELYADFTDEDGSDDDVLEGPSRLF